MRIRLELDESDQLDILSKDWLCRSINEAIKLANVIDTEIVFETSERDISVYPGQDLGIVLKSNGIDFG